MIFYLVSVASVDYSGSSNDMKKPPPPGAEDGVESLSKLISPDAIFLVTCVAKSGNNLLEVAVQ